MKIALYTSDFPGFINEYNIACLINELPQHEYFIISVQNEEPKTNIVRSLLSELKNGKNYFRRDLKKLENQISKITPTIDKDEISTYECKSVNDNLSEEALSEIQPDIILQCGAGILKKNVFSLAKKGTINIHHGIAPEIRGMNSTFWCMYYGLHDLLGVTCHFIDEGLDTGAVIKQYFHTYKLEETFIEVQKDIIINGAKLLVDSISLLEETSKFEFKQEIVDSYYFSRVENTDYCRLKATNFNTVESIINKKSKQKERNFILLNDEK